MTSRSPEVIASAIWIAAPSAHSTSSVAQVIARMADRDDPLLVIDCARRTIDRAQTASRFVRRENQLRASHAVLSAKFVALPPPVPESPVKDAAMLRFGAAARRANMCFALLARPRAAQHLAGPLVTFRYRGSCLGSLAPE